MRRVGLIALLLMGWIMIGRTVAQDATPAQFRDYVLSTPTVKFSADDRTFTIGFTVMNQGADAIAPTTLTIIDSDARSVIQGQDDTIRALKTSEVQVFSYTFNTANFAPNSTQVFQIEAGIDGYEVAGTPLARNNAFPISVTIPAVGQPAPGTPNSTTTPSPTNPTTTAPVFVFLPNGGLEIAGRSFSGDDVKKFVVGLIVGVVIFWVMTVFLRAIFRRPQKFSVWQPPYGTMPTMDPNSVAGRRQAWQLHAQNGTILAAPTEGNLHPVKLLTDNMGNFMQGWRITSLRLSQYDGYGRVGRTETIAPQGIVKRLNRVLQQNARYQGDKLNKQVRPVARALVKQLRSNMTKRTLHLPVAFDVRFEGRQGEVHIVFELYQCQNQAWHRLDRWEPLMSVIGRRLIENYTYTIHGQSSGETAREFATRLPEDVEWLLCETVRNRAMPATDAPPPPQPTYEVPDTVSGMQPVVDRPR